MTVRSMRNGLLTGMLVTALLAGTQMVCPAEMISEADDFEVTEILAEEAPEASDAYAELSDPAEEISIIYDEETLPEEAGMSSGDEWIGEDELIIEPVAAEEADPETAAADSAAGTAVEDIPVADAPEQTAAEPAAETAPEQTAAEDIVLIAPEDDPAALEDVMEEEEPEDMTEADVFYADPETSGTTGEVSWKVEGTTLTISGNGAMADYADASGQPWNSFAGSITKVAVESGVKAVGNFAFAGFSALTEAALADTLEKIGESAFASCTKLTSVTVPAKVTAIGDNSFSGITGLVIRGSFGTTAETYAKNKGLKFVPVAVTSIASAAATLTPASYTYSGASCQPQVSVVYSVTPLVMNTDFTVAYNNNVNAGTATVTITGTGNYSGSISKTFTIAPVSLASAVVSGIVNRSYTGEAQTQAVTVAVGGKTLVNGTDYTVAYANNVNAGTATLTITGKGNYTGTVSKAFTISSISLEKAAVSGIKKKAYAGKKGVTQSPVVKLNGKTLVNGVDYTLSYKNNVKVGKKAKVIITGKGNYNGSITKKFTIKKASIKKAKVTNIKKKTYNGKKQTQKPVVKVAGVKLKKGTDYKITYKNNVNIGTATMTITGKGGYKGSITKKFKIKKATLADAEISGISKKSYTGSPVTQSPVVIIGSRTLRYDTDYTISYSNNVNVGTATMTLSGIGNYKGSVSKTFKIKKASVKNASVSGLKDQAYTGKAVTPKPEVTVSGRVLTEKKDYTLSYQNNVNIGTAIVIIKGKGNYTGTRTATFSIKVLPISDAKITGIEDKAYTGTLVTQKSIELEIDDHKLKKDTDYTIAYTNNINVGTATMTIRGLGSYNGSVTRTFDIVPKGTTIQGASIQNSKLYVRWNAQTVQTDGYMIQYGTDPTLTNGTKTVRIAGLKATAVSISGIDPSQRMYVRIRTYKTINTKVYYSDWSRIATNGAEA